MFVVQLNNNLSFLAHTLHQWGVYWQNNHSLPCFNPTSYCRNWTTLFDLASVNVLVDMRLWYKKSAAVWSSSVKNLAVCCSTQTLVYLSSCSVYNQFVYWKLLPAVSWRDWWDPLGLNQMVRSGKTMSCRTSWWFSVGSAGPETSRRVISCFQSGIWERWKYVTQWSNLAAQRNKSSVLLTHCKYICASEKKRIYLVKRHCKLCVCVILEVGMFSYHDRWKPIRLKLLTSPPTLVF